MRVNCEYYCSETLIQSDDLQETVMTVDRPVG